MSASRPLRSANQRQTGHSSRAHSSAQQKHLISPDRSVRKSLSPPPSPGDNQAGNSNDDDIWHEEERHKGGWHEGGRHEEEGLEEDGREEKGHDVDGRDDDGHGDDRRDDDRRNDDRHDDDRGKEGRR